MLPPTLYHSVNSYANLKMVPMDIVFLPLISLSASLMGHSTIKVDDLGFVEPAVLWTMAVQPKGKFKNKYLVWVALLIFIMVL